MTSLAPRDAARFIRANTALTQPPHVPELRLHLADEAHDLWRRTEEELAGMGMQPPFWAFAWAGGQGLARYVLDNPSIVRGRTVLDFATGSGLVGIAAHKAGAAKVSASDIDPFCAEAVRLNAEANAATLAFIADDLVGRSGDWQVVLAGDVFYEQAFAARLVPWFERLSASGAEIVVGDPGRYYLPKARLERLATYEVPVTRALEDAEVKRTTVWRFT